MHNSTKDGSLLDGEYVQAHLAGRVYFQINGLTSANVGRHSLAVLNIAVDARAQAVEKRWNEDNVIVRGLAEHIRMH